jgi:hypothetical protein
LKGAAKRFEPIVLSNGSGGAARFSGSVPVSGSADVALSINRLRLDDIAAVTRATVGYGGLADFSATATGPQAAPTIEFKSTIERLTISPTSNDTITIGDATATGRYANGRLHADAKLLSGDTTSSITGTADLPIDLKLFSATWPPDSVSLSVKGERASLTLINPFLSGMRAEAGFLDGQVNFSGKWSDPRATGSVQLKQGRVVIDSLYAVYYNVAGGVSLNGDTLTIDPGNALQANTCRGGPMQGCPEVRLGRAILSGSVSNWGKRAVPAGCRSDRNPNLQLTLRAQNLEVINDPALAQVDITTGFGSLTAATLSGDLCNASLSGAVEMPFARFFIADAAATSLDVRRVKLAEQAAALATNKAYVDAMLQRMGFGGFEVSLGDDVRIMSAQSEFGDRRLVVPEIDVKLVSAVPLQVRRNINFDDPVERAYIPATYKGIGLVGDLQAAEGKFVLSGITQRFDVVRDSGYIHFDETLNPQLNVTARTTVNLQGRDQRMGILATLTGRLYETWEIVLSPENPNDVVSEKDLVSYLVTGQPSFAMSPALLQSLTARLAAAQLGIGGGRISDAIRDRTGIAFEGSSTFTADSLLTNPFSYINRGRLAYERYSKDGRRFVRVTSGLCTLLKSPDQLELESTLSGLGLSASYLLTKAPTDSLGRPLPRNPSWSFRLAREPANAQQCSPSNQSLSGLAPVPQSVGWSFHSLFRW